MSKLAINGGSPVRTEKFPKWPQYGIKEMNALEKVLNSGVWGTLGGEAANFVKRFSAYQGTKYGVAVNNGTVSLEVIIRALGIGYGDEVIIPPYTFNATASAVISLGATLVFADIEDETYNIDPDSIEKVITSKTKAIIPVHVGGRMADMDKIMVIAKKHNLYVIEDSAHAPGSEWKGKRAGSIGDAGSFSFQASKNLTSGEGGFITTNDTALFEKCWSIHHCGRDINGTVWYAHPNIGTNARMTEWQAAILNAQMDKLDAELEKRMENAAYLNVRFKEIPGIVSMKQDDRVTRNAYHLFVFRFMEEAFKGLPREKFLKALSAEGVPCSPGYVPLYRQPLLFGDDIRRVTASKIDYKNLFLPASEKAGDKEGIWFFQSMLLADKKDMDQIIEAMIKIYENADELK